MLRPLQMGRCPRDSLRSGTSGSEWLGETMADFGVIIGCCRRDYGFAKGTVASVRHYMPDMPICLLVDGDFPTDDMQRTYGVSSFYRSQVKNAFLRNLSFGWGISKMVT